MLRVTPSYRLLLDFLPLPTEPHSATADVGLFRNARSSARNDDHVDVKGDIHLTGASQLTLTYSRGRPFQLVPRHYLNKSNGRQFQVWDERRTVGFTTGEAAGLPKPALAITSAT